MPKTITLIKVFLAAPGDVNNERSIVKGVIEELNLSYSSSHDLKLELVEWSTHVHPAIGSDAQDVINKQINDDYDIFVGIMWSRFGTPTQRDSSGTKEEFERAFKRYIEKLESVFILQYFKNSPIAIDDIDIEQISKIKQFKEDLKSRGVLFGHFTQSDEFEKIFRLNMIQLLNGYLSNNPNVKRDDTKSNEERNLTSIDSYEIIESDTSDELGMFEYIDNALQNMKDMESILAKISKYITELGNKTSKKTEKLDLLNTKSPDVRVREGRKLIDQLAGDMTNFTQRVRVELPILNEQFSNAIRSYNNAILIFNTFNDNSNEKDSIYQSVHQLEVSITGSLESVDSMKEAIIRTPAMTTKYAKSKKDTVKVLDEVTAEFNTYINLTQELQRTINN